MKLLFPIFASLMLQYQVNTESFGLRRCLMGFGRCKDYCAVGEKEIQKCKKKKCCIGPKVVQMIKNYMQNEMSHTLEGNSQEHLQATKKPYAVTQTKYHIVSLLPGTKSISPLASVNTLLIPNATTVNSATTSPTISWKITYTATSARSDTTESRDVAGDSLPAAPPP
ncbi:beta-defensin 129 [Hyaena hyaena]|uniref:beta-defensin 129 n=1 Tax=Hyaena hyaena TaxID=95912 RepID=UPI001924B716|nr:beta-defensin 129 [Hyaena hyaena]